LSPISIDQALRFGFFDRVGFYKDALPLIPFPGPTPLQNHCSEFGISGCSSGHRSVTTRQELQMTEISTT
jgi:hypothetical protein